MSGKQQKRLRRMALGLATTLDDNGTKIAERGLYAKEHTRSSSPTSFAADHVGNNSKEVYAITAVNRPNTLRAIVQSLKKGLKSNKL